MILDATIAQTPKGWVWLEYDRTYPNAFAAQRAVERDARKRLVGRRWVGTRIEWRPMNLVGTIAVAALSHAP